MIGSEQGKVGKPKASSKSLRLEMLGRGRSRSSIIDSAKVNRRRPDSNRRITVLQTDSPKSQVPQQKDTYGIGNSELTPQLTPKSQKQGKIESENLHPDLAEIVAVWPELPEHIKAAIKALIKTAE